MIIQRAIGDWALERQSCEGRDLRFRVNLVVSSQSCHARAVDQSVFNFTAPHGDPNQVRFKMACSVVVTIPRLRRVCEDCLNRIVGGALVDRVYHGDELLDRVSRCAFNSSSGIRRISTLVGFYSTQ